MIFEVIDPSTGSPVPFGERGQVVMSHLSKFALFPNILERDTAIRLQPLNSNPGASVAIVKPVIKESGKEIIEGVY